MCPVCARGFEPARPGLFSYQSPVGACPACRGFGRTLDIDWAKVIPDDALSIEDGALRPWNGRSSEWERGELVRFAKSNRIPLDVPWRALRPEQREAVLDGEGDYGGGRYPGLRAWFRWLEGRTYKMHVRVLLSRYRAYTLCSTCDGARLNPGALRYRVDGLDLAAWHRLEVAEAYRRLEALTTRTGQGELARRELVEPPRVAGAGGPWLPRARPPEPHALRRRGAARVAHRGAGNRAHRRALRPRRALGRAAPHGPPASHHGARSSSPAAATRCWCSSTTRRSSARATASWSSVPAPAPTVDACASTARPTELARRTDLPTGRVLGGAREHARAAAHAAGLDRGPGRVGQQPRRPRRAAPARSPRARSAARAAPGRAPSSRRSCTGRLARPLGPADVERPGRGPLGDARRAISRVVLVDQAPLGRTSRGNAATYTKAWDVFRKRFAAEPDAVLRGFGPAHFSFNVDGGRCEACSGEGSETMEMQFLADVTLICPSCRAGGSSPRSSRFALGGHSVADVLGMTVDRGARRRSAPTRPSSGARPLQRLGLGYLPLGQPLSTLSGGEAQRVKLARALGGDAGGSALRPRRAERRTPRRGRGAGARGAARAGRRRGQRPGGGPRPRLPPLLGLAAGPRSRRWTRGRA